MLRSILLLILLLPLLARGEGFASQFESGYVAPLLEQTPGGALVIVEQGQVVLQRLYGVKKLGNPDPITDETLFRIASLSKTFASAAASMLVEDTTLTWHTPLKANLAHLRFKKPSYGGRINLQHIMSQSTGLVPHAYTNLIEENWSYRRIVDRLDRVDFVCPPGECYSYQNVAFSLIADLVKAETRTDYTAYVDQRLFQPLGMRRASFGHAAFVNDVNHAEPHVLLKKRWRVVKPTSHYYKVPPAAGVNASIADMGKWLLAQLGRRPDVLPEAMLDEMHQGVIKASWRQSHYPYRKELGDVYYGLGWRVFSYGGQAGYTHHGGYIKGMCSAMVMHRPTGTGMVLLTNSGIRGMNELVLDFAALHSRSLKEKVQVANR